MKDNFKDYFNYLATFLAALFGLFVFKDYAAMHTIQLFGIDLTYLQLSIPIIVLMLVAVYLGGLVMLSSNLNFKYFPLTKYLEIASNLFAAFGLLYPLVLFTTILLSYLFTIITIRDIDIILLAQAVLQLVTSYVIARRYALNKQSKKYEARLNELRKLVYVESTPIDVKHISPYQIVMLYHQLITLSKSILRIKGYGIAGENIYLISEDLRRLDVLNKTDIKNIIKIQNFRNTIIHANKSIPHDTLVYYKDLLESIINKLKKIILE